MKSIIFFGKKGETTKALRHEDKMGLKTEYNYTRHCAVSSTIFSYLRLKQPYGQEAAPEGMELRILG